MLPHNYLLTRKKMSFQVIEWIQTLILASCRTCEKLLVIGGSMTSEYTENHTNRVEVVDLEYKKNCRLKSDGMLHNLTNNICGVGGWFTYTF